MISALEFVLLLLMVAAIAFYLWCTIATLRFFSRPLGNTDSSDQPVSILIPVCGVDEDAEKNWESFCQQAYDQYEVIFGVMNPQDPAVPILEKLVAQFSDRARLIFCLEVHGINHQISNLIHLVAAARYDIVLFTNSDMWVKPEYLQTVIPPLSDPTVGIVTCGYLGHDPRFITAALASLGRCVDFLPSVLVARDLEGGMQFSLGATIALRKTVLEKVGGLQTVVDRVGSDYHLGNLVAEAGYRIELAQYILETDSGNESFQQLFQRELRWARTSRWQRGWLYYSIATTYGTVYCLPLLLLSGFAPWAIAMSGVTVGLRIVQSLVAMVKMGCPRLIRWVWLLPLRDLLNFVIWAIGGIGQKIYWRGRQLQISAGGFLSE
jgi:ceramide glucosyltransferase